jgi:hypothetical protein
VKINGWGIRFTLARTKSVGWASPLHYGKNLPLTIEFCKRHVIRPSGSDEFGGRNVSRHIKHSNLTVVEIRLRR